MTKTNYIQWHDDDIHFVLDKHAELDFYSSSSLKQQTAGRHVASLTHIILILCQTIGVGSQDFHISIWHRFFTLLKDQ